MCTVKAECSAKWREHLPDSCPPTDVRDPRGENLFRFVVANQMVAADFDSLARLDPAKYFSPLKQCQSHAVSVWETLEQARKIRDIMPLQRGKLIAEVRLSEGAGVLAPRREDGHYSWWICGGYDATANLVKVHP